MMFHIHQHDSPCETEPVSHSHHQTLIDIFVDDFVDFFSQLVGNFRLLGLHELAHHGHDVLTALRLSIGEVEIVQRHILNHFLLLVDVTFN